MQWLNKEISELADEELKQAHRSIIAIHAQNETAKQSPQYQNRFKNRPTPEANPTFIQLKQELNDEMDKRKISHG